MRPSLRECSWRISGDAGCFFLALGLIGNAMRSDLSASAAGGSCAWARPACASQIEEPARAETNAPTRLARSTGPASPADRT
jgi:hypothetical protein